MPGKHKTHVSGEYRPLGNRKDLTGMNFGDWTVLEYDPYPASTADGAFWKCRCNRCGKVKSVLGYRLTGGTSTNCGCIRDANNGKRQFKDLTGQKFGRLTVIGLDHMERGIGSDGTIRSSAHWRCRCECGNERVIPSSYLIRGDTRSCGCLSTDRRRAHMKSLETHGSSGERLYHIYNGMIDRCYREANAKYYQYGARGIKVSPEWHDPDLKGWDKRRQGSPGWIAFEKWARTPISEGGGGYYDQPYDTPTGEMLSIDRIDYNGDYEPTNCRFVRLYKQASNKRSNRWLFDGNTSGTFADFEHAYGVSREGWISYRVVNSDWSANAIIYALKHQDLKIRKTSKGAYIDKNGNAIDIPDYGAKILNEKPSEDFDLSHIISGPIEIRFRREFVNPYKKSA